MDHSTTFEGKYGPAMEITDAEQAAAYFEECVQHCLSFGRRTREEAIKLERDNIAYYAGYYSHETRLRVERLFDCEHPFLGKAEKTGPLPWEECVRIGMLIATPPKGFC